MEPAKEVLATCGTIGGCFMAAGLFKDDQPSEALKALWKDMGCEAGEPSSLLSISEETDMNTQLAAWKVPIEVPEGSEGPTSRDPNFMEKQKFRMALRYAKLHHGEEKTSSDPGTGASGQNSTETTLQKLTEQVSVLAKASTAPTVATAKVSLKETVNQVNDGTAERLSRDEINEAYRRYEQQFGYGKRPPDDEEPTEEQLASLKHMLQANEGCYVDFNVWVPHGHRLIRKQRLVGQVLNAQHQWVTVEMTGPATFSMWKACYAVLSNALLMLGAVDLGNLLDYGRFFDRFFGRFGEKAYPLMYQADVRTRAEQFVRINRQAYAELSEACSANNGMVPTNWPYDYQRPWNYVFWKVLKQEQAQWWNQELEYPSLLITTARVSVGDVLGGDALVAQNRGGESPTGLDVQHTVVPDAVGAGVVRRREPGARPKKEKYHNVSNGVYTTSRNGTPLCAAFNTEAGCSAPTYGQWCPRSSNAMHLCNKCLQPNHNSLRCSQAEITGPPRGPAGNGKGKGKKGGKGAKVGKGKEQTAVVALLKQSGSAIGT